VPVVPSRAALATSIAALVLIGCSIGNDPERPPQLGARSGDKGAAVKLGFPATATPNTTRVGGGDAAADVAGVASAVFPATSNATRPSAVVLVDKSDWQGGIAASVLAGNPIGAPILLSDGSTVPPVTKDTLRRLKPKGSDLSKDAQVIRIGERPPAVGGERTAVIRGKDSFELAAAIDRYNSAVKGRPSADVIVAGVDEPAYAMPAAPWAARSGDSVLFVKKASAPPATIAAIKSHDRPRIFLLGPPSAISPAVEKQLGSYGRVQRIEGKTPVEAAIAFARFQRGAFGWGATTPGRNYTLADVSRPLDAVAAAALGTNGVFAPLLLTDDASTLPKALEAYLLDVQPGYEQDPSQGVYNRVWILGDEKVMSVAAQGRLEEITRLIPVELNQP
jgi:putative cell wall binding repeat protein